MGDQDRPSMVLRRAASLIKVDGWTRGALGDYGYPSCVDGAIAKAMGWDREDWIEDEVEETPAARALIECINDGRDGSTYDRMPVRRLYVWNDDHRHTSETAQEITKAIEDCADRLEASGS